MGRNSTVGISTALITGTWMTRPWHGSQRPRQPHWPAGPRMRSGVAVDLPLTAMSSQFVIGSFEARFFFAQSQLRVVQYHTVG
jgi:hypothetical protein